MQKSILKSTGEEVFELSQLGGSQSLSGSELNKYVDILVPRSGMKHKKAVTLRVRKEKIARV